MDWVVKLTRHGGQYRITLPRKLVEAAGLKGVEVVRLEKWPVVGIMIREYHGKGKEKRDIQDDQT